MMERFSPVPASKMVQAAEVIQGLAGSWANSYVLGSGSIMDDNRAQEPGAPSQVQAVLNTLGLPGMPEINFAPYAHRTNRMGSKGGSLIGHPISFSVVGPTLKNPRTNWQWVITDNSGSANGDVLQLDSVETFNLDPTMAPGAFAKTLEDCYGFANLAGFQGGLYVTITQTGAPVTLTGDVYNTAGGMGDGPLNTALNREPLVPKTSYSKSEIFRVIAMDDTPGNHTLTLDPNKRLADYFIIPAFPDNPAIRGITLLKPEATRCLAIPDSGDKTFEKAFIIVSPERALNADNLYPHYDWIDPAFQEDGLPFISAGLVAYYSLPPHLPVPRSVAVIEGRLWGESLDAPSIADLSARMSVVLDETLLSNPGDWAGKIIQIREVKVRGSAKLTIDPGTGWQADLKSLVGWFEVLSWTGADSKYIVRRIDETDPVTGRAYFYPSQAFELDQTVPPVAGDGIDLAITVHEPISSLWSSSYFDYDAVDSARLTNIIDPKWSPRALKSSGAFPGTRPNRADRSVFDTEGDSGTGLYANPGSMADLGFRMVLFPATIDAVTGSIIPDWSRPVTSNEVVLDPAITTEKQWVEIDYANGMIRLSHAPARTGALWPGDPGVFTHPTENPRGELVIFCSCVPYSMEEGQLGGGTRVTGSTTLEGISMPLGAGQTTEMVDVYGERVVVPVAAHDIPSSNGYTGAAASFIQLVGSVASQIPATGFVEILAGQNAAGDPVFADLTVRASTWGYNGVTEDGTYTYLNNIYGGARYAGPDTVAVATADTHVAVFRKQVSLPSQENGRTLVDYQHDTTYGSAKRPKVLRFEDAEPVANVDGSVTIKPRQTLPLSQVELFNDLFSSWLLEGGTLGTPALVGADWVIPYTASVVLWKGRRYALPKGEIHLPAAATTVYLYIGDTAGIYPAWNYAATLPLGDYDHILMHRVDTTVLAPIGVRVDLRYPLADVDKRDCIYVGNVEGMEAYTPHFTTLVDAVDYVNEIYNPANGNYPGRRLRIRVVGYTDEPGDRLPITFNADGIIIEGEPSASVAGEKKEVRWDGGTTPGSEGEMPLIDFNGRDDIIIRDVAFRCTLDETTYPPTDPVRDQATMLRVLFTNTGGVCQRLVIDNCRLYGPAQGFLSIDAAHPGSGLSGAHITRNYAAEVLDAGIRISRNVEVANYSVFENNTFTVNAFPGGDYSGNGGIYLNSTLGGAKGEGIRVSGNTLTGFHFGVLVNPLTGGSVTDNTLLGSYATGLQVLSGDSSAVSRNRLVDVCTGIAGGPGLSVTGSNCHVEDNAVTIQTPAPGNVGIAVSSGAGNSFSGNTSNSDITWANSVDGILHGNTGTVLGVSGVSTNLVLSANAIQTVTLAAAATGCRITDCQGTDFTVEANYTSLKGVVFTGDMTINGDNVKVADCQGGALKLFGGYASVVDTSVSTLEAGYNAGTAAMVSTNHSLTNVVASGLVYFGVDVQAVNCRFLDDTYLTWFGSLQNCILADVHDYVWDSPTAIALSLTLIGNTITLVMGGAGALSCSGGVFKGNHFLGDFKVTGNSDAPPLAGVSHIIDGNTVGGDLFVGTAVLSANNSRVCNNIVTGGLEAYGEDLCVMGNHVTGSVVVGAGALVADGSKVSSNTVGVNLTFCGDDACVSENRVVGNISIQTGPDGSDVISNNQAVNMDFPNVKGDCFVQGNVLSGNLTNIGLGGVYIGNRVAGFMQAPGTSAVVMGNKVSGALGAGGGVIGTAIVMGNRAASVFGVTAPALPGGAMDAELAAGGTYYNVTEP